jgi:ketosteroid isomerase-like protein
MNPSTLSPEDVQALKEITAIHLETGLRADWRGWLETCTDDVMLLPPGAHRVNGREAALEWLGDFPKLVSFEGEPDFIRGSGTFAVSSGVAKAKFEIEGEIVDGAMKWLAVFEKQADGGWKMLADMWNDEPL